jgi:hypothetical protein
MWVNCRASVGRVFGNSAWGGGLVQSACGREVKGVWKDISASAAPDVPFTMVKRSGW